MNTLKTTDNGGFPLNLNDLRWILGQDTYNTAGIYQAITNILKNFGDNFIVQGCVAAGAPGAITEGWIMLGGELIKVEAHMGTDLYYEKITDTYDSDGNKTFQDGTSKDTYVKTRAECTAAAGSLAYNGNKYEDVIADTMRLATTSKKGAAEVATSTEVKLGLLDTVLVSPAGLTVKVGETLLRKEINIGNWNMNVSVAGTEDVSVAHTIADHKKIRAIAVTIRNNLNTLYYKLEQFSSGIINGGVNAVDSTNIDLYIRSTGFFDHADFNSASYNRGWITIWHTE